MKIAQLAGQGTLPVPGVKMFSGSWEIEKSMKLSFAGWIHSLQAFNSRNILYDPSSNPCEIVKKWKCFTKDNWLASILATWGLGPHSSSSPFTPGLQSSPPRKGNWSTLRFGNSYLEFVSWSWPACGSPRSQSNPGIFHIFLFVCSLFTFPIRSLRVRPGHLMLWGNTVARI